MARNQQKSIGIRPIRLFTLFGFDVKLDLSWLLLALLISWSLGAASGSYRQLIVSEMIKDQPELISLKLEIDSKT